MLGMGREDEDIDSEVGTLGGGDAELCLLKMKMKKNRPFQFWSLQKSQSRGTM